jgi:hypothetical protein
MLQELLLSVEKTEVNKMGRETKENKGFKEKLIEMITPKKRNYMKSRITEGKKKIVPKHLDSSNQPTAFQKGYYKGIKKELELQKQQKRRAEAPVKLPYSGKWEVPTGYDVNEVKKKIRPGNKKEEGILKGIKDAKNAKRGITEYKKGGSVKSHRGDGICKRGKTKGRFV